MELSAVERVVNVSLGVCGEREVITWLCSSDLFYTSALEQDERCPRMSDSLHCLYEWLRITSLDVSKYYSM